MLALGPVLDVPTAGFVAVPTAARLAEEPVEDVAVELAQRQQTQRGTHENANDDFEPDAGGRPDVERLEVAVEQPVDLTRVLRSGARRPRAAAAS
jgi:hypothetical protein